MSKLLLLFVSMSISSSLWSLEVDEKLTLKVLNTSSTKKTILINRGLEDGLVKGDHAKFFNEVGVFARAVIVKVSPSRSVWSVYQLIKPEELNKAIVANLKISMPVKVTQDKTKMLSPENRPEDSLIPLSPEAYDDPNSQLTGEEQKDLASLEDANIVQPMEGVFTNKDYEWFALVQFEGLSTSSDLAANGTATGANGVFNGTFGLEKYFSSYENWIKYISLQLFGTYSSRDTSVLEGSQSSLVNLGVGFGGSFHHLAPANSFGRLIGHFSVAFGFGRSEEAFTIDTIGTTTQTNTYNGSSNFFLFGYGLKYFTFSGFGFKAMIEYYRRGESYQIEGESAPFTKVVQGPRMQVGLSYRW